MFAVFELSPRCETRNRAGFCPLVSDMTWSSFSAEMDICGCASAEPQYSREAPTFACASTPNMAGTRRRGLIIGIFDKIVRHPIKVGLSLGMKRLEKRSDGVFGFHIVSLPRPNYPNPARLQNKSYGRRPRLWSRAGRFARDGCLIQGNPAPSSIWPRLTCESRRRLLYSRNDG